jgi:pimeloyl-ACP methyl ester carboxylesterase
MPDVKEVLYPCKIDQSMQDAQFFQAAGSEPRPLVVCLHTWSGDHCQESYHRLAELAQMKNWHMIFPKFRGPNWQPEGCGSELVVSDLEDAVAYVKNAAPVDPARVYLTGGSGGGHCSLLMAGRRPDLWTAVSAWCPISDIALWHTQSRARKSAYADHIESACGGNPAESAEALLEARKRSPLSWLVNAAGIVPVDISSGIHDGHRGSVPVGQAIRAYNILAEEKDRISESDIAFIEEKEQIPSHFGVPEQDPAYGRKIHLRRQSRSVRLTLFEGGHDILAETAFEWLERQAAGCQPDWSVGKPFTAFGESSLDK